MSDEEAMGDEVYQPDQSELWDQPNELDMEDALDERDLDDTMAEGYSPPEKPLGVRQHGTTAREQQERASLDQRVNEEVPDVSVPPGDGIGDSPDMWGEPAEEAVSGQQRAGRLARVEDEAPRHHQDTTARDVGVDGGAASAEEAAMHITEAGRPEEGEEPEPGEAGAA